MTQYWGSREFRYDNKHISEEEKRGNLLLKKKGKINNKKATQKKLILKNTIIIPLTNDTWPWIEQALTIREKQRQFNHTGCQANIYNNPSQWWIKREMAISHNKRDVGWQKVMFFKKKYISFNCETLIQCQANCNRQMWAPKFFVFNNDNTLENMTRGIDWTGQINRTQARCHWTELR